MGVGGTKLFAAQTFEFREGISYIYGLNKSTSIKTNNSNQVGKSFFFSMLGELLYDLPVVGLRQDRVKTGKRFIEFTQGAIPIRL